jgi:membrane protease YdiL (CAAX protease family)
VFSWKRIAGMTDVHHRQTLFYILFSYGTTWLIWLPLLLNARFGTSFHVLPFQYHAAAYGPLISVVLTVLITCRKGALKTQLRKIYAFPKKGVWYLIALGTPWLFFGIAAMVKKSMFGEFPGIEHFILRETGIPESFVVTWLWWILTFGLGEESGWRGFLFQHFTKRKTAFHASLLTSIVWAAWHLPAFFFDENLRQMGGPGTLGWMIGLVSGSIVLSWMTLNAGGSAIPAVVWHGTFNTVVAGTHADPFISGFCSMLVVAAALYLRLRYGSDLRIQKAKNL